MTILSSPWAPVCIGAAVLLVSCVLRDFFVGRRDADAVNEVMRRRR